jgi:hypothetical protein
VVENRRQHDPDERSTLSQLRDGNTAEAVEWYASNDRIHPVADRDSALQHAVDAWADDVTAGHETGLYAWRLANVAALNKRAREWMHATGRLSGPEVVCPGGNRYRCGDCVVTLAPGQGGKLVTSQRAVIESVDSSEQGLTLVTDDGQLVRLAFHEAGADRLGYGYATTVHRCQGSTVARAHLFADGGGRELAYVAMSRARESTQVWAVADDLPQAVEDLRRDWSTRRTPTWAIDTALPDPATLNPDRFKALPQDHQARLSAVVHAQEDIAGAAIAGIRLPDRAAALSQARHALNAARQARAELHTGSGVWSDTEAGRAVRNLAEARGARERAEHTAHHGKRWRDRHEGRKQLQEWVQREADAQQRWETHTEPQIASLDREIERHQTTLEQTAAQLDRRYATMTTVVEHGLEHQRNASHLAKQLHDHRSRIDGLSTTAQIRRTASLLEQERRLVRASDREPAATRQAAPDL